MASEGLQRTLALVKPDAAEFVAEILDRATQAGFTVICQRTLKVTSLK